MDELWTIDGDSDCYAPFPQDGTGAIRTWYEARNKCLHLKGDLVAQKVTSAGVVARLDVDKQYWIGLQRDPLMKMLTGAFVHQ